MVFLKEGHMKIELHSHRPTLEIFFFLFPLQRNTKAQSLYVKALMHSNVIPVFPLAFQPQGGGEGGTVLLTGEKVMSV